MQFLRSERKSRRSQEQPKIPGYLKFPSKKGFGSVSYLPRNEERMKRTPLRSVHQLANVKKRKTGIAIILGLLGLCAFGTVAFKVNAWLRVTTVNCTFDEGECAPEQYAATSTLIGRSILASPSVSLPGYKVKYKKNFPHTISVDIKKPIPVVVLYMPSDPTKGFELTAEGVLLPATHEDDVLPVVIDDRVEGREIGTTLDSSVVDFYKELKSAWNHRIADTIHSIHVTSDGIVKFVGSDFVAILSAGQIADNLRSLQQILLHTTIDVAQKEIDVRFSNPVIKDFAQ